MDDLYHVRFLCFVEKEPQSNQYHQILFTQKQFSELSDLFEGMFPKEKGHKCGNPKCKGTLLKVSDNTFKLPDVQEVNK